MCTLVWKTDEIIPAKEWSALTGKGEPMYPEHPIAHLAVNEGSKCQSSSPAPCGVRNLLKY